MPLLPPTRAKNRSQLADWLEISALISPTGSVSSNTAQRLIEADADGEDHGVEIDAETGEPLEREILESYSVLQIDRLYEELTYRHRLCGPSYPFEVQYDEGAVYSGTFGLRSVFEGPQDLKRVFYVLCLLETGLRDQIISVRDVNTTHHNLGLLFQVASCLALGGYLRGETVWFGFPRPEKTAFLPALQRAFERYGAHKVLDRIPPGYPAHLKDGGIDILAWIDFGDGRGARTIVFGQVASGDDWTGKTLLGFVPKFINWFDPPAPAHAKPAILIPFPIHHRLEEKPDTVWEDEAAGSMLYESSDFGVIFDRFRVARFAAKAFELSAEERNRIDGFNQLNMIETWVSEIIGELKPSEAA